MKLWSRIFHFFDKVLDVFAGLAALVMGGVMALITAEIILRGFFNSPITWSVEITEYSILWITFLSTAWVLKKGGHVVTDVVLARVSMKAQRVMNTITYTVATIACFIFTYYAITVTADLAQRGIPLATVIKPVAWIVYIIIPIGSILLSIQFIRKTYRVIAPVKQDSSQAQSELTSY